MKLLKDHEYALLDEQATAFIAIQTALEKASDNITADDITSDTVIEALEGASAQTQIEALQTKVQEAQDNLAETQTALDAANARVTELEDELAELDETPSKDPAKVTPKGDGGKPETIAAFADKNRGDTNAILEQAKKDGLI